jgi:hypothetical protein
VVESPNRARGPSASSPARGRLRLPDDGTTSVGATLKRVGMFGSLVTRNKLPHGLRRRRHTVPAAHGPMLPVLPAPCPADVAGSDGMAWHGSCWPLQIEGIVRAFTKAGQGGAAYSDRAVDRPRGTGDGEPPNPPPPAATARL